MPEVTLLPRTTVFGYYDHNVVGALEKVADHHPVPPAHTPRQRYWTIRAKRIVLATGAHERIIAFPDNDRPGVMLAGAAETYAMRYGVLPGRKAILFANNDAAYASLFALQDAGIGVAGIADPRADSPAMAAARARGITVWAESQIVGTGGGRAVSGARISRIGSAGTDTLAAADLLLVSGGFNPVVHLASQGRTPLDWNAAIASFVPGTPILPQDSAGAANGIFGIAAAAADGARAGGATVPLPEGGVSDPTVLPFWEVTAGGKSFVDIQDDVTADDIRLARATAISSTPSATPPTPWAPTRARPAGWSAPPCSPPPAAWRCRKSACPPSAPSPRPSPGAPLRVRMSARISPPPA
jgi:sarcosine oxidase subunit alpha